MNRNISPWAGKGIALCLCLGLIGVGSGALRRASAAAAEKLPPLRLIELAESSPNEPEFREALVATLGDRRIKAGSALIGEGPDFLWAIESASPPQLVVDEQPRPPMTRIRDTDLWFETGKLATGKNHTYYYLVENQRRGGDVNVAAYGRDSYEHPDVPQGTLSPQITHVSKIYEGMVSHYWIYVPAQYDASVPAAVMVWNDGGQHVDRNGGSRTQNVIDNLIHQKKIPVMIQIFINPGDISQAQGTKTYEYVSGFSQRTRRTLGDSMRSTEYDTVTDRYARFLQEEIDRKSVV